MVGAREGYMSDQGNLFAAPARPKKLLIVLERRWDMGEDAVEMRTTTWGTKTAEHVWSTSHLLQGSWWEQATQGELEASCARWSGALWSREPKHASVEKWRAHYGG